MIQNVNFSATPNVYKGFLKSAGNGEKVVVIDRPTSSSPLKKVFGLTAGLKKAGVYAMEVPKGAVKASFAGLTAGGAMMSLDWLIGASTGRNGATLGTIITTPFKTIGNLIAIGAKKTVHAYDKSVLEIAAYPFTKFIPQVVKYVKNAENVSKIGKVLTFTAGAAAIGLSAVKTLISINRKTADIDHGYRVGHRIP